MRKGPVRMKLKYMVAVLLLVLMDAGGAVTQGSGSIEVFDMFAPKERRRIEPDWKKINAAPFGSRDNPVRVYLPDGERAYLGRLTCGDGTPPSFRRTGSLGQGPFTTILDHYEVLCGAKRFDVIMDMYHPGYAERRAVPGFSLKPSP